MDSVWKTPGTFVLCTGFPHSYPPVFHIPLTNRARTRKELPTSAADIAVIVAAGANAATVLLGLGSLKQSVTDIREDMRAIRTDIQSCLQTLLLTNKPGNPGEPH